MSKLVELCLSILVFSVCLSSALYEDQAGKFDWKKRFIGKVKYSHIDLKSKLKRVFVATESNVVACLSAHTDGLIWRQVLEKEESGRVVHLSGAGSELVTLSGSAAYIVRGWNFNTGILLYEWLLPIEQKSNNILFSSDETKLHIVKYSDYTIEVNVYNLKTGAMLGSSRVISVPWLKPQSMCVMRRTGELICLVDGKEVRELSVWNSESKQERLVLDYRAVGLELGGADTVFLKLDGGERRLYAGPTLPTQLVQTSSAAIIHHSAKHYLISVITNPSMYEVKCFEVDSGEFVDKMYDRLQYRKRLSAESRISSVECLPSSPFECYILLTGKDHSATLISPDGIVWVREEALASIVSVEMVDLPISDNEAAIEKEFASKDGGLVGMVLRRLSSQLVQLERWFLSLYETQPSHSYTNMIKDTFGLHKLIVVVTEPCKVYGVDNENGDVVWEEMVSGVEGWTALGGTVIPLYLQRSTRVLPHHPCATILFKHKDKDETVLFSFNPITGKPLDGKVELGHHIMQAILLPTANSDFIKGLLLLSKTGKVLVYPESTKGEALALSKNLFMYTMDETSGLVSGYTFAYSTSQELQSCEVWRLKLSGRLVGVASKNPVEKVHSQGRVLADRSVLYKYINPNLISLATLSHDPTHKSILSVYLVDMVSGKVVFSVVHKRAFQPLHMIHSENWLLYSYFSEKSRRTEIVALDLYEGKTQSNTTAFSSLTQNIEPFIEKQAYIFPHHITAMRETITEKGITTKHVLIGVSSGRVMEVSWGLLDPRRPTSLATNPELREELLIPYIPEISLPAESTISYNHTLHNIKAIHTSPAGLESTSLVFVYGLDVFYTRVAPSKTFDVLKDDFEYWLISAVLGGLGLAAYITKRLSSRKALKQAWK